MTDSQVRVSELFVSLQGEGPLVGMPTAFVRLTGCPLRCVWCDTAYAFRGGDPMSFQEIGDWLAVQAQPAICLTGGEPLAAEPGYALAAYIADRFPAAEFEVETSGAFATAALPRSVRRIVDWKAPSSGEGGSFLTEILVDLGPRDALKFVIDQTDFTWLEETWRAENLSEHPAKKYFHAVHGSFKDSDLAAWMIEKGFDARMGSQMHKIWWPDATRGV